VSDVENVEVFEQERHILDTFLRGFVSRQLLVLSQSIDEFRSTCITRECEQES